MWGDADGQSLRSEQPAKDSHLKVKCVRYSEDATKLACLAEAECKPLEVPSQNRVASALRDGLDDLRRGRQSPMMISPD